MTLIWAVVAEVARVGWWSVLFSIVNYARINMQEDWTRNEEVAVNSFWLNYTRLGKWHCSAMVHKFVSLAQIHVHYKNDRNNLSTQINALCLRSAINNALERKYRPTDGYKSVYNERIKPNSGFFYILRCQKLTWFISTSYHAPASLHSQFFNQFSITQFPETWTGFPQLHQKYL